MSLDELLNRKPPGPWDQFCSSPLTFSATFLYHAFPPPVTLTASSIRVVCVSDTHNGHDRLSPLPDGDVLIHAGDLTETGTVEELTSALEWLSRQPHPHKVFIAGNHERCLGEDSTCRSFLEASYPGLTYLEDSSVTLMVRDRALNVYGSPRTPAHGNFAFQYRRIRSSTKSDHPWTSIPAETDILITHGPPFAHLDEKHGCHALLDAIWRVKPRLHVFGHIHSGRGVESVTWGSDQRAFEQIIQSGGWMKLVLIAWGGLQRAWAWFLGKGEVKDTTLLVNASSAGGYRDELRRGPLIVDI